MTKYSYFWLLFVTAIVLDQLVKELILGGFRWESSCISIVLAFNYGVAFSMFSFLKEWLKYIQIAILLTIFVYIFATTKLANIKLPLGLLLGAGVSNVIDRFVHGGVVDYVFWHCGFEFAIFNLADVLIDFAVVWIIYLHFKQR
jgi:signal peptidase II